MPRHVVTAAVTGGEVTGRGVHKSSGEPDYTVTDLRIGTWSCSCGKENMSSKQAADHLREVNA